MCIRDSHRTLLGDGLATSLAGFLGGPANTTYGENTGVLELSRVHDPRAVSYTHLIRDLEQAAEHIAANALYQIEVNHVASVSFDGTMVRELLAQ